MIKKNHIFHNNSSNAFLHLLLILYTFLTVSLAAREQIEWIGSIKNQSNLRDETTFKNKVFNFLFGKSGLTLNRPVSIVCYNRNHLWILDQDICTPVLIDHMSANFEVIQSEEKQTYPSLVAICSGNNGYLYFTDSYLNEIFVLNSNDKKIRTLTNGIELDQPTGIAYNPISKLIYVAETGKHRIIVLNHMGQIIKTIGQRGKNDGEFNFPTHLWINKKGQLYIVDSMNFKIQIFSANGKFITMFGEPGNSSGYLARPKGIATDSNGNIYVVDALFHVVQIFNSEGTYLYSFGKKGKEQSEFWLPSGIFVDDEDKIYVADSYNSRIQIFQYISGIVNEN